MNPRRASFAIACVLAATAGLAACGGDTLGVATTVANVTPTNFATIPPVASTAPGTTTTLPTNAVGSETTYIVQPGDSPLAVANKYNISLTTLLAYNGWVTAAQFPYPGETVRIPANAVVNPGQSTGGTGTGTGAGTGTGSGTGTGTGTGAATTGCGNRQAGTYKVQSNDSLYKIRQKFCVSLGALLSANGWADSAVVLLPGDVINIPAAGS